MQTTINMLKKKKSCNRYFAAVRTSVRKGCIKQWKQNRKTKVERFA